MRFLVFGGWYSVDGTRRRDRVIPFHANKEHIGGLRKIFR